MAYTVDIWLSSFRIAGDPTVKVGDTMTSSDEAYRLVLLSGVAARLWHRVVEQCN